MIHSQKAYGCVRDVRRCKLDEDQRQARIKMYPPLQSDTRAVAPWIALYGYVVREGSFTASFVVPP
jgi:hypothetical protein